MKVLEKIDRLQFELETIKEKYCDGCQAFTCDYCAKMVDEDGKEGDDW